MEHHYIDNNTKEPILRNSSFHSIVDQYIDQHDTILSDTDFSDDDDEHVHEIKKREALRRMIPHVICDKKECFENISKRELPSPPSLERQDAFQFKENVKLSCIYCGSLCDVKLYY